MSTKQGLSPLSNHSPINKNRDGSPLVFKLQPKEKEIEVEDDESEEYDAFGTFETNSKGERVLPTINMDLI
jgi:hypothetical protein